MPFLPLLPVVSGLLLALCLPPAGLSPLAWLGLAPLLLSVAASTNSRSAFGRGWLAGATFFAMSMHWIYSTCRFAAVPIPISLLAWAALAGFLGLNWGLFAVVVRRSTVLGPRAWPWVAAAGWAAIEFLSARFTPRVGGDLLGYTQWRLLTWLQPSSWFGPHALGFLIVLANAAIAQWWLSRSVEADNRLTYCSRRHFGPLKWTAALVALWWTAGALSLVSARPPQGLQQKVAILQPDIDQYAKWDAAEAGRIRATFDGLLTKAAAAKPALIVWPESAVPGWLEDPENFAWVAGWAKRTGAYHLVGAISQDKNGAHNSAALFDPAGSIAGRYDKRQLVPFGEFVPFRRWLEPYIGILAQMGDFGAGPDRQPMLETPIGPVGTTICYEAVFPRWNRLAAAAGARALVNVTNDGWYKETWGPLQHLYANRFRAIENRMPVVRAGNTGISAFIDPWGRLTGRLDLMKEGVLLGEIPSADPFPRRSFYARTGDWFGWICVAASACALAAIRRIKRL